VGPRAGLDTVAKSSRPLPGMEPWNPDTPARSLVSVTTELSRILSYLGNVSL